MRVKIPRRPLAAAALIAALLISTVSAVTVATTQTASAALSCGFPVVNNVRYTLAGTVCVTEPFEAEGQILCPNEATTRYDQASGKCIRDPIDDQTGAVAPIDCSPAGPEYRARNNSCFAPSNPDGSCPGRGTKVVNTGECNFNGTAAQAAAGGLTEEEAPDNCPIAKTGQPLRWAACPIFDAMYTLTSGLDAFINEYMTTGNEVFDGPNKDSYKAAWSTFRTFGISLVIIAGLVMLISEALGLGIVDAYTVRKVLPRLLVAVIGISVSWELSKYIVGFFDELGQAMGSIIYTSFLPPDQAQQGINIAAVLITTWFVTPGIVAASFLIIGPLGLLSLLGTLVLAMLVGAVVLIARQAIIIAAILLAPLAIAAYILPNTNKLSSFWWNTFTSMLMLYPIATGLIALCKVLGYLTLDTAEDGAVGSLIGTVVGIVFFVIGYALLPLAFRLAGGLVATIGGIANDKTRGGFDRLKGFRGNETAKNISAMGRGERFKGGNGVSSRFNNMTKNATTFGKSRYKGAFLTNKDARSTAISERDEQLRQEHMKSEAGAGNMFNDDSLKAQAAGSTESESRANMKRLFGMEGADAEKAISQAKANGGFSTVRQRSAVVQAAATGTVYEDAGQMAQVMANAAGGNEGVKQALVGAVRQTGGGGRFDLVGMGHTTLSKMVGESMESGGQARPSANTVNEAMVEVARSNNASKLLSGKPKGTSNIANALVTTLQQQQSIADNTNNNDTVRNRARDQAAEISSTISNMKNAAPFATEVNLSTMNIGRQSVAQPVNLVRGNQGFENTRTEDTVRNMAQNAREQPVIPGPTGAPVDNPQYYANQSGRATYNRNSQSRIDPNDQRNPLRDQGDEH